MSNTRFYRIWKAIKTRCNNPNAPFYYLYGGRGIKVEWGSFEDFYKDMFKSYEIHVKEFSEKNTSIDRINSNGNYCKTNCHWATARQQSINTSQNRRLILNGKNKTLIEWSEEMGISRKVIHGRLDRLGWSIQKTLTTPTGKLGTNQFTNV